MLINGNGRIVLLCYAALRNVSPLGSGPGKVFIGMVMKNVKLNNSGCVFQIC